MPNEEDRRYLKDQRSKTGTKGSYSLQGRQKASFVRGRNIETNPNPEPLVEPVISVRDPIPEPMGEPVISVCDPTLEPGPSVSRHIEELELSTDQIQLDSSSSEEVIYIITIVIYNLKGL